MKTVSVIVPTYKRNSFILRAIDSILSQDYPSIEIIVVDDNGKNSVDQIETFTLLKSLIDTKRIIYVVNPFNVGGAISRNNGILVSSGDYITFLDDDDVYLPGKISAQVRALEANGWDLCVMDGETYNEKGELLSHKIQPIENGMTQNELLRAHLTEHITGTNVFMYRRDALLRIGMFDEIAAGQEFMLMLKSINGGLTIGVIHEVMVHFHMDGQDRISTNINKIDGLKTIYSEKRKFFKSLSEKEIKYIKTKHFGTLFYTYFSNQKYMVALFYLLKAFFSSPRYTWMIFLERKGKLIKGKL